MIMLDGKFIATFYRLHTCPDLGILQDEVISTETADTLGTMMICAEAANFTVSSHKLPTGVKITYQREGTKGELAVLSGSVTAASDHVTGIKWVMPVYDDAARSAIEQAIELAEEEIAYHVNWSKKDANRLITCVDHLYRCLGSPCFQDAVNDVMAWQP